MFIGFLKIWKVFWLMLFLAGDMVMQHKAKDKVESMFNHYSSEAKAIMHLKGPFVGIRMNNAEYRN